MANFNIRVELRHPANDFHYVALHSQMEKAGLGRTMNSTKGAVHLPRGEYCFIGEATAGQLLALAKRIANSVAPQNSVVVTKWDELLFDGLEPAA